jgi:hypothetical protein
MASSGVVVRWQRSIRAEEAEPLPVAPGFRGGEEEEGHRRWEKRESFQDAVAGTVKAFVGLIYQEQVSSMRPARQSAFISEAGCYSPLRNHPVQVSIPLLGSHLWLLPI